MTSEITTSTGGSSSRRRISAATQPTTSPIDDAADGGDREPADRATSTNVPLTAATTAAR